MSTNNESATEKSVISIPHVEIRNFKISLDFSQYWISYGEYRYPIFMTPYEFLKLFEIEGIPIESFTDNQPILFTKAVLMKAGFKMSGEVFDEEGGDCTPQPCWVKQNTPDASTETLFIQTSY